MTTTTEFSLGIEGNNLRFGAHSLPILDVAKRFWIYTPKNEVKIYCNTQKGSVYNAGLILQLQEIDKVRECIKLLITNTQAIFSIPALRAIQPDLNGFTLRFDTGSLADEFYMYYAPGLFPEEKCVLEGKNCKVICQFKEGSDDAQIARINQVLAKLNIRTPGHIVEHLLYENKDARFPGKKLPEATYDPLDFEGLYLRVFGVTPERISLVKQGLSVQSTNVDELDQWLHYPLVQRSPEIRMKDVHNWGRLRNLIVSNQGSANDPFIKGLVNFIDIVILTLADPAEKELKESTRNDLQVILKTLSGEKYIQFMELIDEIFQ